MGLLLSDPQRQGKLRSDDVHGQDPHVGCSPSCLGACRRGTTHQRGHSTRMVGSRERMRWSRECASTFSGYRPRFACEHAPDDCELPKGLRYFGGADNTARYGDGRLAHGRTSPRRFGAHQPDDAARRRRAALANRENPGRCRIERILCVAHAWSEGITIEQRYLSIAGRSPAVER